MNTSLSTRRQGKWLAHLWKMRWGMIFLVLFFEADVQAAQPRRGNPDFLIKNWLEGDGLPESSAYAVAQTPDGYLWVGTGDGVFRFNGLEFAAAGAPVNDPVLNGVIQYLYADHAGRLWASSDRGLGVRSGGGWRTVAKTNAVARSMTEDAAGHMYMGTYDGRVFAIQYNGTNVTNATNATMIPMPVPEGMAPSGAFCLADARDGGIWLANRGFIGRLTPPGWVRLNPPGLIHNSLVAGSARGGGIWTYIPGKLTRFFANGTFQDYPAPDVAEPRALLEDRSGNIWIASSSRGYFEMKPGGRVLATVNESNGLVHNSSWCLLQDLEGNFWLGGSCGGLSQLRPKVFDTIGVDDGLPNQIVRTVAEESPGHLIVGTDGGGTARIQGRKVVSLRSKTADPAGDYSWCVVCDESGRTWLGTYAGGLFVQENGVERNFPLPEALGQTVNCLMEDSHHRIWVGTGSGAAVIDQGVVQMVGTDTTLLGTSVRAIAEDPVTGAIWLGTYDRGLFEYKNQTFEHYSRANGLPGNRVSSVYVDHDGCLWAGIFGKGLVSISAGRITPLGYDKGFPAHTAGSIIEDGLGWFWFCSDHGIIRVAGDQLRRAAQPGGPRADFVLFEQSDGLVSADCSEGFQPAVVRDHGGRLWFATINGVVTVDPAKIQFNTNPPPVVIEHIFYWKSDGTGAPQPIKGTAPVVLGPGKFDLEVDFAVLSLTAPEKNRCSYRLTGYNDAWVTLGNRRSLSWPALGPGDYTLQIKASNNDEIWNDTGATFAFTIKAFFWQTQWFRALMMLGMAVCGGLAAWGVTVVRLRRKIEVLEQQRALERERARLATVMEATSDLVAFADDSGRLLHINPAGRKLLGLDQTSDLNGLTLVKIHPGWAAEQVAKEGIPAARRHGTWEGETALLHQDGREIPVTQTIMAHQGPENGDSFLSTIARDLRERKRAEQASERLQAQLLQAQKMESVGRLAGGIAHDFNNMLQVILGNADLALEESESGSQLHMELLEIRKSASRSAELTGQLLTFARKSVYRPQELNLNEIIGGTSKMLQRLIGENIRLDLNLGEKLWPVRMDPSQVTQILTNLAINARDAINGQGRLVIEVSNVVLSQHQAVADAEVVPGEFVLLSVRDNGGGMTAEVLDHLFEPFFTTKDVGKGTGLGLATVFGIVKQNQGLIQVDSTPGEGSTFRIYFPRSIAQNNISPLMPQPLHPTRGTETILIVEDEENILHLVVLTLRKYGYQVIAALTPETAINMAAAHNGEIHLLITDIVMPGMNGKELKDKLAVTQPRMKSLYMSGYTADVIAQHGALEADLHFLQKPFTIQSFLEKVRKILDTPFSR